MRSFLRDFTVASIPCTSKKATMDAKTVECSVAAGVEVTGAISEDTEGVNGWGE